MKPFLFYPVKKNLFVTQYFGNQSSTYTNMGMLGHNGIDYAAKHGDPIYASHDGIGYYEIDDGGGNGVVIRSTTPEEIDGKLQHYKTIYWHLCDPSKEPQLKSPIFGSPGKVVKAGDIIGYADNTGISTGDHLHFGMKTIALNEDSGAWYNLQQNNGYFGAIDPLPYFNGYYAEDAQKIISILRQAIAILTNFISSHK